MSKEKDKFDILKEFIEKLGEENKEDETIGKILEFIEDIENKENEVKKKNSEEFGKAADNIFGLGME